MRDLQELMKTQVMSSSSGSTIHHALKLHNELDRLRGEAKALKEENANLKAQNQSLVDGQCAYVDLIRELENDLKAADEKSTEKEKKLVDQLSRLQVSWDSLYDDLAKVRDERNELRVKLEEIEGADDVEPIGASASLPGSSSTTVETARSPVFQLSRSKSLAVHANDARADQAALLRKAVQRTSSFSTSTRSNFTDRKTQELEVENLKLKSTIVRLQTQYKEERYRSSHPGSHRSNSSLSKSESSSTSLSPPSKHPSPIPEQCVAPSLLPQRSIRLQPTSRLIPSSPSRMAARHEEETEENDEDTAERPTRRTSRSPVAEKMNLLRESSQTIPFPSATNESDGDDEDMHDVNDHHTTGTAGSSSSSSSDEESEVDDEVQMKKVADDTRSTATATTVASTGSSRSVNTGMFGGLRRTRSLYPGSSSLSSTSPVGNSPHWGRSPARNQHFHRENQSILLSHPAYSISRKDCNDSQSSFSSLSETSPVEPKRVRSLVRWW